MAVTLLIFPPLFRKPKNANISKRSGVRVVIVDYSKFYLLTLQAILNLYFNFIFGKIQLIK